MKYFKYLVIILLIYLNSGIAGEIHVLKIDGVINPVAESYLHHNISKATESPQNIECIIIQLDTPGGLMSSMRKIIKTMMSSDIPIVVYISPSGARAGSAGVFITYAASVAAMAPGTNMGAAHPVNIGGSFNFQKKDTTDSGVLKEKVTNDAVAFVKSLAKQHNRNIEWAEKSVRGSASITETEALENNVIEIIAEDLNDLISQLDGYELNGTSLKTSDQIIVIKEYGLHRRILDVISDPNVAYILMILGFWGIVFEIRNPGAIFPGAVGTVCLILAFFAFQILPINYTGIILIFLALVFFILEVYITSFGLLSIGGIILMVLGSMMLIDVSQAPQEIFAVSLKVIIPIVLFTAAFFIFAFSMALKTLRTKTTTGKEGMVGKVGTTISEVTENSGQVMVHGEVWRAVSSEIIPPGQEIIVDKIESMKLIVSKKV
ncbi:MAG: NfeD family protein [Fidelibacterota bacterium]